MRIIYSISVLSLLYGLLSIAYAGDSTGVSSESVIRAQLQSIAKEVVDSARLDPKVKVDIFVEGAEPRTLVENAFIEVLQKNKYTSVLNNGAEQKLQVFLVNTDVKVQELNPKLFERNMSTTLEVRTVTGAESNVQLLGTFHRETKDTVQSLPTAQYPVIQKSDESGVMQKLLTPIIVIGASVLIVYLLFTVRS
jgi:hypothetical protein